MDLPVPALAREHDRGRHVRDPADDRRHAVDPQRLGGEKDSANQVTISDPSAFKPEPVVELWDLISKQDWEVCQRAQTGVGSRAFTTGVYPRQDRFLYDFNERYRKEMGRALLR